MSPVFDYGHGDDAPQCPVCFTEMELAPFCAPGGGTVLKYFCPRCEAAAEAHRAFVDHERNLDLMEKD